MGLFITFEGGEGAGKSTQIKRLAERLKNEKLDVVLTREPGGSPGAEAIRHILLSGGAKPFGAEAEVLLFATARLDHVKHVIAPALTQNSIVLCDRFHDSTRAYQGGGEGVADDYLDRMEEIAIGEYRPDITIILDVPPELGLERVTKRLASGQDDVSQLIKHIDRFEADDLTIHQRRRDAFLSIAQKEPSRCIIVDATQDADEVAKVVWSCVQPKLEERKNRLKKVT